jgi:hypothetical protein
MQAYFDLGLAKKLVRQNKFSITRKGSSWLINHGFDAEGTVKRVVSELKPAELFKVYPPNVPGGNWADAYHYHRRNEGFDQELYVKFTIEEGSGLVVIILSCKEWNYGW